MSRSAREMGVNGPLLPLSENAVQQGIPRCHYDHAQTRASQTHKNSVKKRISPGQIALRCGFAWRNWESVFTCIIKCSL